MLTHKIFRIFTQKIAFNEKLFMLSFIMEMICDTLRDLVPLLLILKNVKTPLEECYF